MEWLIEEQNCLEGWCHEYIRRLVRLAWPATVLADQTRAMQSLRLHERQMATCMWESSRRKCRYQVWRKLVIQSISWKMAAKRRLVVEATLACQMLLPSPHHYYVWERSILVVVFWVRISAKSDTSMSIETPEIVIYWRHRCGPLSVMFKSSLRVCKEILVMLGEWFNFLKARVWELAEWTDMKSDIYNPRSFEPPCSVSWRLSHDRLSWPL
jgi:hypothetical protein